MSDPATLSSGSAFMAAASRFRIRIARSLDVRFLQEEGPGPVPNQQGHSPFKRLMISSTRAPLWLRIKTRASQLLPGMYLQSDYDLPCS